MKLLLGFLALCLVHCIVADFESFDLNDEIQQRITDVLEAPKISLSGSDPSDHALRLRQFRQFVSVFRRHYASNFELRSRFEAFKSNMEKKEHYEAKETGTAQYGMTEFMDYEENELSRFSRMCKKEPDLSEAEEELFQNMVEVGNQLLHNQPLKEAPASVDYRKKGWVSKVLDQGYCGSSWAYAAVTALETANAIKTGHFERLSKQQLIDCDKLNHGCCGGYIHLAYLTINQTGIELDATYNGRKGLQKCHFTPSKAKVHIKGLTLFTNTSVAINEKLMEHYVAEHGPVAVMLTAGALPVYKKGIMRQADSKCSKNSDLIASSISLVGYGEEDGIKYWIAKNSWGPKWGEKGFIRFERGTNMCGVGSYGVAPVMD